MCFIIEIIYNYYNKKSDLNVQSTPVDNNDKKPNISPNNSPRYDKPNNSPRGDKPKMHVSFQRSVIETIPPSITEKIVIKKNVIYPDNKNLTNYTEYIKNLKTIIESMKNDGETEYINKLNTIIENMKDDGDTVYINKLNTIIENMKEFGDLD